MVPPPPTSSPTSVNWPSGDFQYHGHNNRFSFIELRGVARSNQELPGIWLRLRLGLVCKRTNPHIGCVGGFNRNCKSQTPGKCYFHSNNDCTAHTCCSRGIQKCHCRDTGSSNRRCHRCSGSKRYITIPEFQLYRVCRFTSGASNRNLACSYHNSVMIAAIAICIVGFLALSSALFLSLSDPGRPSPWVFLGVPGGSRQHQIGGSRAVCAALRSPTRYINSPATAGANCQEEGGNEAAVGIYGVCSGGGVRAHCAMRGYGGYFPA